jgi:hypothetical protein
MKMQNNKKQTTVIIVLVIGLVMSSQMVILPNANAQPQINSINQQSACLAKILKSLPELSSVQQQGAKQLAEQSNSFLQHVGNSGYSLASIAPNYSFNPKTCSDFKINAVTVGFKLGNGSSLAIYEDGNITKITGVNIMHRIHGSGNSTNYAGYQVYYQANSGTNSSEIYGLTNYYQPSVSSNSECSNAQPYECVLSVWAGLDNDNNYLAQTGTDAVIDCQSGSCQSQTNDAWYEFYSSGGNYGSYCPSADTVSSSDQMEAVVENGAEFGGSNDQFKTILTDSAGSGWICSSGTYTWTNAPVPNTALAILETPVDTGTDNNQYFDALPTFTSITNSGNTECYGTGSGQCPNFYSSTSNGWYYEDQMSNCPSSSYDIQVGSMDTSGDFTSTYDSSCGTSGRSAP